MNRQQALSVYPGVYQSETYRMGGRRKEIAFQLLADLPRGSHFDVGAGRGEVVEYSESIGNHPVRGCEAVQGLIKPDVICNGLAHDLPAGRDEYDIVTMFDVMEHLTEPDCFLALEELRRVAKRHVLLSINNLSSIQNGYDLHITKKPYDEWDRIIRFFFDDVRRFDFRDSVSEIWRIDI